LKQKIYIADFVLNKISMPGIQLYRAYVILRLKMEWRGCCDWNPNASEERSESYAVSGICTLPGMSRLSTYIQGPTFKITDSRPSTRENIDGHWLLPM
jgi:hypothetical protein